MYMYIDVYVHHVPVLYIDVFVCISMHMYTSCSYIMCTSMYM